MFTMAMVLWLLTSALPFLTARRKNNYAAIHDLISRTRVVRKSIQHARPAKMTSGKQSNLVVTDTMIGPYHVVKVLHKTASEELILCHDLTLKREVWVRRLPAGALPVSSRIRDLSRPGRLHWLNGHRSAVESWDAYEAASGMPFLNLTNDPQSWKSVRFWIMDLAEEITECLKDQSLPGALRLDQVWITTDGHAKLVDFPVTSVQMVSVISQPNHPPATTDDRITRSFLHYFALIALSGQRNNGINPSASGLRIPIALHARCFLGELGKGLATTLVADRLKPLLKKPAFISRLRRLGVVVGSCSLISLLLGGFLLLVWGGQQILLKKYPDLTAFGVCVQSLQELRNSNTNTADALKHREALETYIAGHFRDYITDPLLAKHFANSEEFMTSEQYALAKELIASHPTPSESQVEKATSEVKSFLGSKMTNNIESVFDNIESVFEISWFDPATYFMRAGFINLLFIIPNLVAAFLFRGGPVMRLFGVAIVRENGSPASRFRILWRSFIGNGPFLLLLLPLHAALLPFSSVSRVFWTWALEGEIPAILLILMIWSALLPTRSIQDRLARTYLVPR
jgi:hypothetical protein